MSNSDALQVLGLPEDADRAAIKRAYAELVKLHHPEDDPSGFANIRDAYEMALASISRDKKKNLPDPSGRNVGGDLFAAPTSDDGFDFGALRSMDSEELAHKTALILGRMEEIYSVIEFRRGRSNWEACFKMKTFQELRDIPEFIESFLGFLDTHRNFPSHMWRFFNAETDLLDLLDDREQTFGKLRDYVQACVFDVPEKYGNTFDYLRSTTPSEVLEPYIVKMLQLQRIFAEERTDEVVPLFEEAARLLPGDRELFRVTVRYLSAQERTEDVAKLRTLMRELRASDSSSKDD